MARPEVEVVVPQREISYGGWTGVGYVVTAGLSTDYRISGGLSGGAAALNPDPNGPFGALAKAVERSSEQVKEASDCDYLEIAVLALIMLLIVAAIVAMVYLWPVGAPLFTVEILAFGVAVDAPLLTTIAWKTFLGGIVGYGILDELEKC